MRVPKEYQAGRPLALPLIAEREKIGANTPTGYTISTLAEQTENKRTYIRPPWAKDRRQTLDYQIEKSLARLGG